VDLVRVAGVVFQRSGDFSEVSVEGNGVGLSVIPGLYRGEGFFVLLDKGGELV
jgi:hypothetical protein